MKYNGQIACGGPANTCSFTKLLQRSLRLFHLLIVDAFRIGGNCNKLPFQNKNYELR